MPKLPGLSDLQSRQGLWSDALVLAGGVAFFVCISAVTAVGFSHRSHSFRATSSAASTTIGATLHSRQ